MDIPAKFASVEPNLEDIIKHFRWRSHPVLPELSLFCLPKKNNEVNQLLEEKKQSWQWAYLWECGVVLARYILDHPNIVQNKVVYDLGTGQGTVAIAAKKAGAKISIGLDCSAFPQFTLNENSSRNNVNTLFYSKNVFDAKIAEDSIIFASDLVYGQGSSNRLIEHLVELGKTSTVIISVSGRNLDNPKLSPKYEVTHPAFYHLMNYEVECGTPGLEPTKNTSVSLWTTNSLILQGS